MRQTSIQSFLQSQKAWDTSAEGAAREACKSFASTSEGRCVRGTASASALEFCAFVDAVCARYNVEKHAAVRCIPPRSRARVLYAKRTRATSDPDHVAMYATAGKLTSTFARDGHTVIGKYEGGALVSLSVDDIHLCKEAGVAFRLPENLNTEDASATQNEVLFRLPEFDSESEQE